MTMFKWEMIKNFNQNEFKYPDLLSKETIIKLDRSATFIKKYWAYKHKSKLVFIIIADCDITGKKHSKNSRHNKPFFDAIDFYIKDVDNNLILPADEQFILISQFNFGGIGFYPYNKYTPAIHVDMRNLKDEIRTVTWFRNKYNEYRPVHEFFENTNLYKELKMEG